MDLLTIAKDIADRVEAESVTQDLPVAAPFATNTAVPA
jgi:hypothetical protein